MKFLYKASHSILPCLFLTMSVGMIYAFSLFIPELTSLLNVSKNYVQFAFALSIFFLGFSASCFGGMVERNVKLAACIAMILFPLGLVLTHFAIIYRNIWLLYLGTGVCMGIGEGIAYLCPVKNMILWFSKSKFKGLIMAVSIVSFGLGATICTGIYGLIYSSIGLNRIFLVLAGLYFVMMLIGTILIRKPKYAKIMLKKNSAKINWQRYVFNSYFVKHWVIMCLNIAMGLVLIGNRKNILIDAGISEPMILTVFALCGFTNAFGRLLFPFIGDFLKNKLYIIPIILILEFMFISPAIAVYSAIPLSVILVEAGYGGIFAIAPQVLLFQYGSKPLSIVHGILLFSWAIASIIAFFVVFSISAFTSSYWIIILLLSIGYFIIFLISLTMRRCLKK